MHTDHRRRMDDMFGGFGSDAAHRALMNGPDPRRDRGGGGLRDVARQSDDPYFGHMGNPFGMMNSMMANMNNMMQSFHQQIVS